MDNDDVGIKLGAMDLPQVSSGAAWRELQWENRNYHIFRCSRTLDTQRDIAWCVWVGDTVLPLAVKLSTHTSTLDLVQAPGRLFIPHVKVYKEVLTAVAPDGRASSSCF